MGLDFVGRGGTGSGGGGRAGGRTVCSAHNGVVSPPTGKAEIGRERKMSVSVAKSVAKSVAIVRSNCP